MSSKFTISPPSFSNMPDANVKIELDRFFKYIYSSHGSLSSTAVKAPAFGSGFAVQSGSLSVKGSKTGIATGLSTVSHAVASVDNGATASAYTVSCRPSPTVTGGIDVYVWQPTAAGDTTPTAATSAVTVHWWATGGAATTT